MEADRIQEVQPAGVQVLHEVRREILDLPPGADVGAGRRHGGAGILGVDEGFRRRLAEARTRLAPNRIGKHGQIMEWLEDYEEIEQPLPDDELRAWE